MISAFEQGQSQFNHLTYLKSGDKSSYRWMEFRSRIYPSDITNTIRITSFLKDCDDEVRNKERLKIKAETDALTGLLNREFTMRAIQECIHGYALRRSGSGYVSSEKQRQKYIELLLEASSKSKMFFIRRHKND